MNKETEQQEGKPLNFIDAKYENGLYLELLDLSRMLHSGTRGRNVIVREVPEKNPLTVRKAIRENLDFIRVTVKYMLLDVEATRRERDGLSGEDK